MQEHRTFALTRATPPRSSWGKTNFITLHDALAELEAQRDGVPDAPAVVWCDPQDPRWEPQHATTAEQDEEPCVVLAFPQNARQRQAATEILGAFEQRPFAGGLEFVVPAAADRQTLSARLTAWGVPHSYLPLVF